MDYHGISYDVVEVDPVLRQSIKWSKYRKVPILLAEANDGYQMLLDSTMIISSLSTFLKDSEKKITDVANFYPFISYEDEGGLVKNDILNKYFVMYSGKHADKRRNEEIK